MTSGGSGRTFTTLVLSEKPPEHGGAPPEPPQDVPYPEDLLLTRLFLPEGLHPKKKPAGGGPQSLGAPQGVWGGGDEFWGGSGGVYGQLRLFWGGFEGSP